MEQLNHSVENYWSDYLKCSSPSSSLCHHPYSSSSLIQSEVKRENMDATRTNSSQQFKLGYPILKNLSQKGAHLEVFEKDVRDG